MSHKKIIFEDPELIILTAASFICVVMYYLKLLPDVYITSLILLLLSLLAFHEIKQGIKHGENIERTRKFEEEAINKLNNLNVPSDVVFVGLHDIGLQGRAFGERNRGTMLWFNMPLGKLITPDMRDFYEFLGCAIENKNTSKIKFVLDESRREFWEIVKERVEAFDERKVVENPDFVTGLKDKVHIGFKMINYGIVGMQEAQLVIWGRPFMATSPRVSGLLTPTCLFHVKNQSLIENLIALYVVFGTVIEEKCLFSWDDVPGSDSWRCVRYLMDEHDIGWAKSAEIHKSNDGKTISILEDKISAEIIIDEMVEKAILKVSDGRIYNLRVRKENGKLNIYK